MVTTETWLVGTVQWGDQDASHGHVLVTGTACHVSNFSGKSLALERAVRCTVGVQQSYRRKNYMRSGSVRCSGFVALKCRYYAACGAAGLCLRSTFGNNVELRTVPDRGRLRRQDLQIYGDTIRTVLSVADCLCCRLCIRREKQICFLQYVEVRNVDPDSRQI